MQNETTESKRPKPSPDTTLRHLLTDCALIQGEAFQSGLVVEIPLDTWEQFLASVKAAKETVHGS